MFKMFLNLIKQFLSHLISKRKERIAQRNLQKNGLDAMLMLYKAAEETGATCSPFFGTLLGIYREGDFIKHDDDIDFTMNVNYLSPEFLANLKRFGFVLHHLSLASDYNGCLLSMKYEGVLVEIYFYTERENKQFIYTLNPRIEAEMWAYYQQFGKYPVIEYMSPKIENMEFHCFKESKVLIPSNTDSILRVLYGDDYLTPIKGKKPGKEKDSIPIEEKYWHLLPIELVDDWIIERLQKASI